MRLTDSVALVTGANRGLGARLVTELLAAGARRVYATARDTATFADDVAADPRVRVLALDVTDDANVRAAAAVAGDVTVLVNNAGVLTFGGVLDGDLTGVERDLATNYLGALRVTRAFAPVLEQNAPAGFHNPAMASDLRFQAAVSHWLMSPPRTGRHRILPGAGSGAGDFGRGGRSCSVGDVPASLWSTAECGRRPTRSSLVAAGAWLDVGGRETTAQQQ